MKLEELVTEKKTTKPKRMKILISESQFKVLAKNVLNEQAKNTIKKTHLIKTKNDAKKK